MKYIPSFILILLISMHCQAQETANLSALFGDQKQYILTNISPEHRGAYLAQIHLAHIVHSKVWAEIKKTYPTLNLTSNWNMVERFSPQGELKGVIWTGAENDSYYQFIFAADQKLTVTQSSLAQLSDTTSTIVSNFQNWDNQIFVHNGQTLGAPREHPFYLGSRISGTYRQIICFNYP